MRVVLLNDERIRSRVRSPDQIGTDSGTDEFGHAIRSNSLSGRHAESSEHARRWVVNDLLGIIRCLRKERFLPEFKSGKCAALFEF